MKGGNAQVPANEPSIIGTDASWNAPLLFHTNGIGRMKLNGSLAIPGAPQYSINGYNAANGVNTTGYLLLGHDWETQNGNPSIFDSKGAFSLLHLTGIQNSNGTGYVQEFGYRPWMKTGTGTCGYL